MADHRQVTLARENSRSRQRSLWGDAWRRFARNRTALAGLIVILMFILASIIGPSLLPYSPLEMDLANAYLAPGRVHFLGTDNLGRDVLTRILSAARIDLGLTFVTVVLAVAAGLAAGTTSGYFGGALDTILMRFVDLMLVFPDFMLGLALVVFLGPSLFNVVLVLAVTRFPRYARLIRGTVLANKGQEYVQAAHMVGAPDMRIIARHILPNSITPIIVYSTLDLGSIITSLAGLSFLGVGIQAPTPDWGLMLTNARNNLFQAPWTAIFPGLAISLTVIGFNLMGDGLRDALDPRLDK